MLIITCPHCGPRNETDFSCGGESHVIRPSIDCSDSDWADYLFNRRNPRGLTYERWRHSFGCGAWFNIARDTRDHAIVATYAIAAPKPELKGRADG